MKVEVKDVLKDVNFISASVKQVLFVSENGELMYRAMPAIDKWNVGTVRVEMRSEALCKKMIECLARYSIVGKQFTTEDNKNIVTFKCAAGDDIIQIIASALSVRRLKTKSSHLDNLNDEVKELAKQIPYVQSSMFSRGVKKLRHSVETLKKVVIAQQKEIRK